MDRTEVLEKIKTILEESLHVEIDGGLEESTTFESLSIDSLDMVELILAVEETFDISVENNLKIETAGQLIDYIESKQA